LREVARIEAEMDRVLRQLGRADGSVRERMQSMRQANQLPAEPDPRPALLARYTEIVRDAERRSEALFNLKPRARVEVRRVPPLTEATASAYYSSPAPDGTRPGIFWVPMRGPVFSTLSMRSLAYHEAVPGHHFQLAIQQEQAGLPKFRSKRIFGGGSAHSEGWALYTERLAIEQGWYEGDIPSLLGALDSQLFRARRLVSYSRIAYQRLDPPAGHRLRNRRFGSGALRRRTWPGVLLHDRHAAHPELRESGALRSAANSRCLRFIDVLQTGPCRST
jgi:uncharacterized protein (DUF885 family)